MSNHLLHERKVTVCEQQATLRVVRIGVGVRPAIHSQFLAQQRQRHRSPFVVHRVVAIPGFDRPLG